MPGLRPVLPLVALLALAPAASLAAPPDPDALAARVRKLLEALVAADTENPPGNEARAVAVGAARLRAEGIPFETFEFAPGRSNLIVRIKGDGTEKPLLLLAHIDVVPTAGQPWTVPAHQVTVKGDRLYGRGVYDDLPMAAAELEVAILLAKARVPLRRDVIVAWTGGEETAGDGIRWQLANHPGAIADAGLVLNEGGNFRLGPDGKPSRAGFLVAEKGYQDFAIRVKGAGGHSSAPRPGNAIVRLAQALDRIDRSPFPPRLVPAARTWFGEAARIRDGGDRGRDERDRIIEGDRPARRDRFPGRASGHRRAGPDHLRAHPGLRGDLEERAARLGVGERELPDPSGGDGGGRAQGARARGRRPGGRDRS